MLNWSVIWVTQVFYKGNVMGGGCFVPYSVLLVAVSYSCEYVYSTWISLK